MRRTAPTDAETSLSPSKMVSSHEPSDIAAFPLFAAVMGAEEFWLYSHPAIGKRIVMAHAHRTGTP